MSLTEDKRWETFCAEQRTLAATPPEAPTDGCRFGPFSSFAGPDLKSSISQNSVCLMVSRGAPSLLLLLLTHLESRRAVEQPRSVISNSWGLSWQLGVLARSRSEHVRSLFGSRRRCERWKSLAFACCSHPLFEASRKSVKQNVVLLIHKRKNVKKGQNG